MKIKKLTKRVILDLSKSDIQQLRGGQAEQSEARFRTIPHETHVNMCFTRNCCRRRIEQEME